jgi:hypothetical protein
MNAIIMTTSHTNFLARLMMLFTGFEAGDCRILNSWSSVRRGVEAALSRTEAGDGSAERSQPLDARRASAA